MVLDLVFSNGPVLEIICNVLDSLDGKKVALLTGHLTGCQSRLLCQEIIFRCAFLCRGCPMSLRFPMIG